MIKVHWQEPRAFIRLWTHRIAVSVAERMAGRIWRAAAVALLLAVPQRGALANDPPTTNSNSIFYQGNQSTGIWCNLSSFPYQVFVNNLAGIITPANRQAGITIVGLNTNTISLFVGGPDTDINANNAQGIFLGSTLFGGNVCVSNLSVITASGLSNQGAIQAESEGYNGGNVTITNSGGQITTHGSNGDGLYALSWASIPGSSGIAGGTGGTVIITNNAQITTYDDHSIGIFGQSLGGTGGNQANGGAGGAVIVINSGAITNIGNNTDGLFAQSLGGKGGDGDNGGTGGAGGAVTIIADGPLTSSSSGWRGVYGLSQGGNGGNGTVNAGAGGGGGNGGTVIVAADGQILNFSSGGVAVEAVSQGGQGGNGGNGGAADGLGGGGLGGGGGIGGVQSGHG